MPQVKIHISKSVSHENKSKLVNVVREMVASVLVLDEHIGQVILYESEYRGIHAIRNQNFVFVEVTMYSGRTKELKQTLADAIIHQISNSIKVDSKDIVLVYYEMNQENYFGGVSHRVNEAPTKK